MLSMFLRVVPHLPPSYLNSDAFSTLQQEDHPFYPKSPLQTAAHHTPATSTCILSVTREGFLEDRESQDDRRTNSQWVLDLSELPGTQWSFICLFQIGVRAKSIQKQSKCFWILCLSINYVHWVSDTKHYARYSEENARSWKWVRHIYAWICLWWVGDARIHEAYEGNSRRKGPSPGPKVDPSVKNGLQVSTSHVVDRTITNKRCWIS